MPLYKPLLKDMEQFLFRIRRDNNRQDYYKEKIDSHLIYLYKIKINKKFAVLPTATEDRGLIWLKTYYIITISLPNINRYKTLLNNPYICEVDVEDTYQIILNSKYYLNRYLLEFNNIFNNILNHNK